MSNSLDARGVMLRFLPLSVLVFAGCGKPTPPAPATEPGAEVAAPAPEAKAGHEMDPAKHAVPKAPVAGMLDGKPFVPDRVTVGGKTLTFRQGAGFAADAQIAFYFADYKPAEPLRLTVKPSQKWHADTIPSLHVSPSAGDNPSKGEFVQDGYALTLELDPRAGGKIPGRVYLGLPGAGKNFMAGAFTATYERELDDAPEPEDRPFIAGKIFHGGKAGQKLSIAYAGLPANGSDPIYDGVAGKLEGGRVSALRSTTHAPRVAGLRPGTSGAEFDCARLPPGKYFVMARLDDGPVGWKLVDLAADSGIDAGLTVPAAMPGGVDVTVPAKAVGQVQAIPAGLKLDDPLGTFTTAISGALGAFDAAADSKATLKNLAPGRYEVSLRSGADVYRAEVEVESGKAAKVELK